LIEGLDGDLFFPEGNVSISMAEIYERVFDVDAG